MFTQKRVKGQILGFWIHPRESSSLWGEILEELKERGVEEVGLFITDGLRAALLEPLWCA